MQERDDIGASLARFHAALKQSGSGLTAFAKSQYMEKWQSETIFHVLKIRTTKEFGESTVSKILDLVENSSMKKSRSENFISKFAKVYTPAVCISALVLAVACITVLKGVYIDSPNIRLELESPVGEQRGRYLIDFSQMDIEVRRDRFVSLEEYFNEVEKVKKILKEDLDKALGFFEGLIIHTVKAMKEKNEADLSALGVKLEVPTKPFPSFFLDDAKNAPRAPFLRAAWAEPWKFCPAQSGNGSMSRSSRDSSTTRSSPKRRNLTAAERSPTSKS